MKRGLPGGGKKTRDETSEAGIVTATPEQRAGAGQSAALPSPARRLCFQFCSPGTLFFASRKLYVSEGGVGEEPPEGDTHTVGDTRSFWHPIPQPRHRDGEKYAWSDRAFPQPQPQQAAAPAANSTPTPHLPPCTLRRADWWAASTPRYGEGGTSFQRKPKELLLPRSPPLPLRALRPAQTPSHTQAQRHLQTRPCPSLTLTLTHLHVRHLQTPMLLPPHTRSWRYSGPCCLGEGSETSSQEKQAGAAA